VLNAERVKVQAANETVSRNAFIVGGNQLLTDETGAWINALI
jgi:hypothetical protein